jgi:putative aminopeptidase FrvX
MELLKALYKVSSPSGMEKKMIRFITRRLKRLGVDYSKDEAGNIYAVKGRADTYPCIVAHTDEVHQRHNQCFEVVELRDEVLFGYDSRSKTFAGIGADDKNGIWICLKCLEEFDLLKCAFFVGEECGCIGSNAADMTFFDDCRFVVQCDRKGGSDLIVSINGTALCSDSFIGAIAPYDYGYAPTAGLLTDVFTLKCRGLKVSCVNISCGYYNPHTDHEYTRIGELHKCLGFVSHIVSECTEVYEHISVPHPIGRYGWGYPGLFDDDRADYDFSFRGTRRYPPASPHPSNQNSL